MSGLTPQGFQIERLPEIKSALEKRLTQAFGDLDLRAESVFGQFVGINAEVEALLWALAEDVYFSQYPDTASGISLDHVCALIGVVRRPARPTQVTAVAYGEPGTTLSESREASNKKTGDVYRSVIAVTINAENAVYAKLSVATNGAADYTVTIRGVDYTYTSAGGETDQQILTGINSALSAAGVTRTLATGTLEIRDDEAMNVALSANLATEEIGVHLVLNAIETGPIALAIGDLTEIKTPVFGWNRINNLEPGILGANAETDGELRARRERSIRLTATNTLDAVFSRLSQTTNVTDLNVLQNNGTATDANGTDRQHIWAIVEGGEDDAIARVLFDAVAAGIGYRGTTTVTVNSEVTGKGYQVSFDRPTYLEPTIAIQYTALSNFPTNGEQLVKDALVARTFVLGEKLIVPRLYTPINTVEGIEIEGISINGVANANLIPDPNEKIRILESNITLTAV